MLAVDTGMITALDKAQARIWIFDGDTLTEGPAFPLLQPHCAFDRFLDGRWLVVARRTNGEPNARIFSVAGAHQSTLFLGDGIGHAKVDDVDRLWIGWFDEGIFGNRNWQVAGLEWPPSSYGICCLDVSGGLLGHVESGPSAGGIADVYALNVANNNAWACTYTDFPILKCGDGAERWWRTSLQGPTAIAVNDDLVLAAGGYGKDGNQVVLVRLHGETVVELGRWRLPFEAHNHTGPISFDFMDARGDTLHLVAKGEWCRWSVSDFSVG